MWFLRPSAPAAILQSYDQNISYLSGKPAQKHWPQTLFQDLGGVDSLQLYHSTGRFTARIRTDTIHRFAPARSHRIGSVRNAATIEIQSRRRFAMGRIITAVAAAGLVAATVVIIWPRFVQV